MGYGRKNKNVKVSDEDANKLYDLSMFNETDPKQMIQKLLIIFGSRVGFRGATEHYHLKRCHVGKGYYPPHHNLFSNLEWYSLVDMGPFKNQQLGVQNDYLPEVADIRFPVISDGKHGDVRNDAGGTIKRYCEMIEELEKQEEELEKKGAAKKKSSNQARKTTDCFYRSVSYNKVRVHSRLGMDTIRDSFRLGFQRMGISNWETLHSHATRHWFITTLANNPHVNWKEVQIAARHKHSSTTVGYTSTGQHSEGARVLAFAPNINLPSSTTEAVAPGASPKKVSFSNNLVVNGGNCAATVKSDRSQVTQAPSVFSTAPHMSPNHHTWAPLPPTIDQQSSHPSIAIASTPTHTGQINNPPQPTKNYSPTPPKLVGRVHNDGQINYSPEESLSDGTIAPRTHTTQSSITHQHQQLSLSQKDPYSPIENFTTAPTFSNGTERLLEDINGIAPNETTSGTQVAIGEYNAALDRLEEDRLNRAQSRRQSDRERRFLEMTEEVEMLRRRESQRELEMQRMERRLMSHDSPYSNDGDETRELYGEFLRSEEEEEMDELTRRRRNLMDYNRRRYNDYGADRRVSRGMNSSNVNGNRRSGGNVTGRRIEFGEENGRRRNNNGGRVLQNPYLSAGALLRRERGSVDDNGRRIGGARGVSGNGNGSRIGRLGRRSFEEVEEVEEHDYQLRRTNRGNRRVENPYSSSTRSRRRV